MRQDGALVGVADGNRPSTRESGPENLDGRAAFAPKVSLHFRGALQWRVPGSGSSPARLSRTDVATPRGELASGRRGCGDSAADGRAAREAGYAAKLPRDRSVRRLWRPTAGRLRWPTTGRLGRPAAGRLLLAELFARGVGVDQKTVWGVGRVCERRAAGLYRCVNGERGRARCASYRECACSRELCIY